MASRVERTAGGAIVVAQMNAVVLDRFGGVDELSSRRIPLPEVGDDDVLIRVEFAGAASWDALEREGGYDGAFGVASTFP
jgi:NADPH:quinone reductase